MDFHILENRLILNQKRCISTYIIYVIGSLIASTNIIINNLDINEFYYESIPSPTLKLPMSDEQQESINDHNGIISIVRAVYCVQRMSVYLHMVPSMTKNTQRYVDITYPRELCHHLVCPLFQYATGKKKRHPTILVLIPLELIA